MTRTEARGGGPRQPATPSTPTAHPPGATDLERSGPDRQPRVAFSAHRARRLLVAAPTGAYRRTDTVVTLAGGRLVALLVLDEPTPRRVRRDRIRVARRTTSRLAVAA